MNARLHRGALSVFRVLPTSFRRRIVRTVAPSYTVGAICFIERPDGSVLFARQHYRRNWGVPGGLVKRGESTAEAALRETLEEIGVEVDLIGEPAVVVDPKPQRVDVIYRARLKNPNAEPRPSSPEIVEVRWFPSAELPKLQAETGSALVALARTRPVP